jgi:hypothetical protein
MATLQAISFKNFNMGGIADSDYLGAENSVSDIVGFDIHSEPGILKINQALTKESGSTIDDFVKAGVASSDGSTYLFGSTNGKIWKRTSGGTYSLEATASPAAGSAGILDAKEYQGYIYYAMQNRLGRVAVGAAWSTRNDNWATFTNGDASWHPMKIVNLVLYVGDANYVAQVDDGVFSANALDISAPLRIKCLGQLGTDLLLGTYVSDNINETQIYRWNTWSVSFSNSDPIPEVGINAFLATDNFVIVNAGTKGQLYTYDGNVLEPYKQIKGTWDATTNKAVVHPNAVFNYNGLPLFGLSMLSGAPCNLGVYSLGRANRNYPYVLNCEVGISSLHLSSIEIGAILGIGDIYLVSWKDTTTGTVYGVDKLDLTAKYASPYITTRIMMGDRTTLLNYNVVNIAYRLLPTNTTFNIYKKVNNGSFVQIDAADCEDDTDRQVFVSEVDIGDATKLQVKIAPTVSGNTAPEMEMFEVLINK